MSERVECGDLYLPTNYSSILRIPAYRITNQFYCSFNFSSSGVLRSQAIESCDLVKEVPRWLNLVTPYIPTIWSIAGKFLPYLFKKFRKSKEQREVWPKTLSPVRKNDVYDAYFCGNNILLGSPEALLQYQRIVSEAREKLQIVRVAFSEDLKNIPKFLELVRKEEMKRVEIYLASPDMLLQATQKELEEFDELPKIFKTLKTQFGIDPQAKSKYLKQPKANFTRAAADSLCAIKTLQNFLYFGGLKPKEAAKFRLFLYFNPPTFRGTITNCEIACIETRPWQPGIVGNLHAYRYDDKTKKFWKRVAKEFKKELISMKPLEVDIGNAYLKFKDKAVDLILKIPGDEKKGNDRYKLVQMIEGIQTLKATSADNMGETMDRIIKYRELVRNQFAMCFLPYQ